MLCARNLQARSCSYLQAALPAAMTVAISDWPQQQQMVRSAHNQLQQMLCGKLIYTGSRMLIPASSIEAAGLLVSAGLT
jgi:hypothetical protein